ncbi:MAG: GAF domain-containing protein [Gaiellales bacterium]
MSHAEIEALLAELGEQLDVQRVTLRLPSDESVFPIAYEWCAPGVHSIRDTPLLDMSRQPVVLKMQAGASQVVEDDCATATDDAGYHEMREMFGGLQAQIVTANRDHAGEIVGLLSVHDLTAPRTWSESERRWARETADALRELTR